MAKSPLTDLLNTVSGGDFTNPSPIVRVPQAAPVQPVLPSNEKVNQVVDASQRINQGFAAKGQFPTLGGEIARLNAQQEERNQRQQEMTARATDFNGANTADLQSGSLLRRFRANVINDVTAAAGTVGSIALQLKNTPRTIYNMARNADFTDEEIGAFNREQQNQRLKQSTQIQKNALIADDILNGTPGQNLPVITALDRSARNIQDQSETDKALLNRDASVSAEIMNNPGVPDYAKKPMFGAPTGTVRDQLSKLQKSQQEVAKSVGSQATGEDNEWGTQSWTNTVNQQEISQRLAEENKGKSTLGAIANTIGEYLQNPGAVGMVTAQSLPYAAGLPGIIGGTVGQFTQDVSDATGVRGDGGVMRSSELPTVAGYSAADAGLNFAENLVASRAMRGLMNTFTPQPLREAAGRLMENAALQRVAGSAPVRTIGAALGNNVTKSALFEGLTEAAQNQIQTRNLLGNDTIDREGNIEAGVLGALSSVVMSSPTHIAQGVGRGVNSLASAAGERIRTAQEQRNPQAAEARQAAMDAAKPFENLTNPEHEDYNPQAAIRQQTNVFADKAATPEMRQAATERAASIRDNAEEQLASVEAEIAQHQRDAAMRPAIEQKMAEVEAGLVQQPDNAQLLAIRDQLNTLSEQMNARALDEAGAADLMTRYDAAQNNAERIRSEYDKFSNAAGLNQKVAPEEVQQNIDTVSDENAAPEQVQQAADHVVSHPMQYTPDQLRGLADDTTNRFNDDQREAIRKLADARVAQNELKTNLNVNADITGGGKGYRGLSEYMNDFSQSLRERNGKYARNLLSGINRFNESHAQKAALARQILDSGVPAQLIRKNGQWVINEGKKLTKAELKQNGGLLIHRGSSGIVSNIEAEAAAIAATQDAMTSMAKAMKPTAQAEGATTTAQAEPKQEVVEPEAEATKVTKSSLSHYANDGVLTTNSAGEMALRVNQFTPEEQQFLRDNNMVDADGMVRAEDLRPAKPKKDEAHKPRTIKQQERNAPAEEQTRNAHPDQNIDNETDNAPTPVADTEQTVNSDQTTATATQEKAKAEGAVTVLRPEGKSLETAREEEASKPVAKQNLVLTGFAQSVREGFVNPLVTVRDFMTQVMKKADWSGRFTELNRYLATPMDDAQKKLMANFIKFHDAVSKDIDTALQQKIGKTGKGLDKSDFNYQDFMQYLIQNVDGKLTIDENVKTALTSAMYSWLGENGGAMFNTPSDVANMLHIEEHEVTTATFNRLAEVGSSQRAVVQALGQRAYQALGFKVLKNVDPNRAGKMQQALGMYAMHTLMKRGYFEVTSLTPSEYVAMMTDGMEPKVAAKKVKEFANEILGVKDIKDFKGTFNFVRVPRKEVAGKLQPDSRVNSIIESHKATKGIMSKLFGFDSGDVNPLVSKPGKFLQRTVGDFNQEVPSELAERLTKAQQQPYRVNDAIYSVMDKIRTFDESALLHMMGVRTEEETPYVHARDRIGQAAKNDDIARGLTKAFEFIPTLGQDEGGRSQAIYMPLTVWSNNRVGVASNTLNPQGNKVHRILVGMEAHETSIPVNQAPMDSAGNVTDYGRFLLTVAQGMEEAPIVTGSNGKMPTVDKVTAATYLQGMETYLASESVRSGVDAMLRVIEGQPTAKDVTVVKNLVAEFGMGPHSFQSLHALAMHEQARRNGADSFTTAIGGESDGVTNGPILTNILYGTASFDLLQRGGLYRADAGVTNVPQYREKGGKDYYQLLGAAQREAWDAAYPKGEGKDAAFRDALDYLSPGYGDRGKAKVLATPFNYGSGMDSLKRASARDAIDGIYKHIAGIAKAYDQNGKQAGDEYKVAVENAIRTVLNQIPELNRLNGFDIKQPKFAGLGDPATLLERELPKDLVKAFSTVEMATRGKASEEAINNVAKDYIDTRDRNTSIANAAYEVNKVLSARLEEKALADAVANGEVGEVNGLNIEGLSSDSKAALKSKMKLYSNIIVSATGSLSSNKLESGYVGAKVTSTYSQTKDQAVYVQGNFAQPANPVNTGLGQGKATTFSQYSASAQVKTEAAPGVSTGALIVQGTDAAISTSVISQIPSQNFHDANLFGIKQLVEGAQIQNKAMWDAVTGYESQIANVEAMLRPLTGVSKLSQEAGFQPSDWKAVQASILQLAFKHEYSKSPKDPVSAEVVLGLTVEDAYNREITKLKTLSEIEYVNQYGYEGGEYRVTDSDRKVLAGKIADLESRRDKAVTEAKALGRKLMEQYNAVISPDAIKAERNAAAQRRIAQEQAAADSQVVDTGTTKQNSLERFLSGYKDGKVPAKELMSFVANSLARGKTDGSALQTKMRTVYAEISKVLGEVLPDNLEINIISATTNPKGVMGMEMNANSRAWYYSDGKVNQINIKMAGTPGLEVVLHEALHAATAQALDTARRNPKANPEVTRVLERMTDLHSRVKAIVEGNPAYNQFTPAVRNVDEMLAWGMTNPDFQNFLDRIKGVPPAGRSRKGFTTMFREFATNVLHAVYAFAKRKPNDKAMTAAEALIMDTAELLQAVPRQSAGGAINLPMVNGANSANAVRQYTHREVFDSLANSGFKQNSSAFILSLGKTIQDVSDKLYSQIGGEHLTSMDSTGYTPGQVWAQAIVDGKAPFMTKALSAGFQMTDQEAFAIESIESAVNASLASGFGSAVNREIRKSWEAARKNIKPEQFHNGNWATATQAEKDAAQKKWDHLFTLSVTRPGDTNRYLSQFVAMTLGHEETSKLMDFTTQEQASGPAKSYFESAVRYASHAFNYASGLLSKTHQGQLVNQKAAVLAKQLVQIDLKNRDKSVNKLDAAFTYVSDMADNVSEKALDAVHATASTRLIMQSKSPIIQLAGSMTRLTAKRNLNHLTDTLRQLRDFENPNTEDGWAAQILSDISNPDKVRSVFESLLRHTGLIEQRRRSLSEIVRGSVMEHFQDSGKYLQKEDHEALTYTLLRTEAHSLLNMHSMDQVAEFIRSPAARNKEIARLEAEVLTQNHGNDMVIRAKALGYYLVTGKSTIPGLVKNAQAIASGAATHYVTTNLEDRNSQLTENIDALSTLYALQYSKPEHLKRTSAVMQRELSKANNGIQAMLNTHKVLSEDAASTLFADNVISRAKGYIPEVTNPYRDVKVVEKSEGQQLEQMGYQFVGMVPVDPTIPSAGQKAMYVTQDNGAQRYVSGATSLTSNHRKGSNAIQNQNYQQGAGATVADGRKAVYAASQKRTGMKASDFDPQSVKDTYMIPVLTTDGRISDFRYEMQHGNRDTLLDRNNNGAHLLGQYAGQSFDKLHSPTQNRVIMDALHQDFTENYAKSPISYVDIGPMAKDARGREIWAMLPEQTRYEAEAVWGAGNGMKVRSDLVNLVFGFRKYSIGEAFDKSQQNAVESMITGMMQTLLGDKAKQRTVQGERVVQEAMALFKDIIVIRNVKTMVNNQISNFILLKAYGVPMGDIIKNTKVALQAGLSYRKNTALLLKLQHEQRAGLGDYDALEQKIIQLEDQLARNPLREFIEAGTMPSIVDDVDTSDTNYTYASGLQRKLGGVTEKVPETVRTAAKWAFVSKGTPAYKFLANAAQFSDFTSKYVLYNYSRTKAPNKLDHAEAIQRASDAFVNYDAPTSKELQYMNDMGLMMFTKYKIRIQRAMLTLMKERPGAAMAQSVLVSQMSGAQYALEPNMFSHMGNPFTSSVLQIPNALDEPFPIKLMSNVF